MAMFHLFAITLLIGNMFGVIPMCDAPASQALVSLGSACVMMLALLIQGISKMRHKFIVYFMPEGSNALLIVLIMLEMIAWLSRMLSLGIRLAINLNAGKVMTHVILNVAGASIGVLTALGGFLCFEIMVAYLQAYIFMFILFMTKNEVKELM